MPNLILLRHGESQWNLENRFTGWVDVPLSEKGKEEARRAGEKLKNFSFDVAYTSMLKRAVDTLKIVLKILGKNGLPVIQDAALNERHYGDLQGLNKAETAKKYGEKQVHIWRRSFDVAPPKGESLKDTAARTLPYFEKHIVTDLRVGKNVLVSAHGNSLRSIVMQIENLTPALVVALEIPTGIPILYQFSPDLSGFKKKVLD